MQSLTAGSDSPSARSAPRITVVFWATFAVITMGLCAWRLSCVRVGPDLDSDAYGHFLIARQLLATPFELRIHWVWLPLYHLLLAAPIALGATLDQVRQLNALGAMLPPVLLLWALARARPAPLARARPAPLAPDSNANPAARLPLVALGAASLTAASPLLVQLGTTGQMEIAFTTLLTLAVAFLVRERFVAAAATLSALVLMRYEGWAVALSVGVVFGWRRLLHGTPLARAQWACVLAPGCCVLAWATLRWLGGERWFGFIFENQAFAEQALETTSRAGSVPLALARYTVLVPWRTFGLAAICALMGVGPTLRRHGIWLVAPGGALLAFLCASSLTRSQLGLDRHFASVVPFAATWIAHGLVSIASAVARGTRPVLGSALGRAAGTLALAPFLLSATQQLSSGLETWSDATRDGLREQREIARRLRSAPRHARILCADASIEVLSELAPERFDRSPVAGQLNAHIAELAPGSDLMVVGRARELRGVGAGAVLYGDPAGPPDSLVLLQLSSADAAHHGR